MNYLTRSKYTPRDVAGITWRKLLCIEQIMPDWVECQWFTWNQLPEAITALRTTSADPEWDVEPAHLYKGIYEFDDEEMVRAIEYETFDLEAYNAFTPIEQYMGAEYWRKP